MSKTIDQLKQEYADNERKLQQAQHQLQRMDSRIRYYEKGDRQKRAHRLITKGAAIESVMPELKDIPETDFYKLTERIFSLPEVKRIVQFAAPDSEQRDGD